MAMNAVELLKAIQASSSVSPSPQQQPAASASIHPMTAFLSYMNTVNRAQPAKAPERPGAAELTGRGFMRGVYGLGEGVGTALEIAGDKLGLKSLSDAGDQLYISSKTRGDEYAPPDYFKPVLDDPWQIADLGWLGYNIANMIPSLAASIVPAVGAGRAAGAAINIAGKALKWTPELATKIAALGSTAMASGVGGAVGGALEASDSYRTVLEQTGDKAKAEKAYVAAWLITAGLNAIPLASAFGKSSSLWRKALVTGFAEGTTETAEEPAQAGIEQHYTEGKITMDRLAEAAKNGFDVFIPAFITGGIFGAASGRDVLRKGQIGAKPTAEQKAQLPGLPAPERRLGLPQPQQPALLPAPDTIYGRADQPQPALPAPPIEGRPVTDSVSPIDLKKRAESEAAYQQAGQQAAIERQAQVDLAYEQRAVAEQQQRQQHMDTASKDRIDATAQLVDFISRHDRQAAEQPTAIQLAFQQARSRLDKMATRPAIDVPPIQEQANAQEIRSDSQQLRQEGPVDLRQVPGEGGQNLQRNSQEQRAQAEQQAPAQEPWQLTAAQWATAREDGKPSPTQPATRESATARAEEIKRLNFGVTEEIAQKIHDGITGKQKVTPEETAALQSRLHNPVTHRDVIAKAVREGKPVPDVVLNEYPDLRPQQPAVAPIQPAQQQPEPVQQAKPAQAPQAQPQADIPLSRLFDAKALKGKTVSIAAVDPETKKTVRMDEPADEAVARVDKQIDFAKRLLECLSS